jgi:hypothetical protein
VLGKSILLVISVMLFFTGLAAQAAAQTGTIMGNWNLAWKGSWDTYSGTLQVQRKATENVYEGVITLHPSKGGTATEKATITMTGDNMRIEGSDPSFVGVPGVTTWNPDRFYLNWTAADHMDGYSLDSSGQRGPEVKFTRQ